MGKNLALGLGAGLLSAQSALGQYLAAHQNRLAQERQSMMDQAMLNRQGEQDKIANLQRYFENASPGADVDPSVNLADAGKYGFGGRIQNVPALQASGGSFPAGVTPGAAAPSTPMDGLMQLAPKDLSVAPRKVIAPTFGQQQAIDARGLAAKNRTEDISNAEKARLEGYGQQTSIEKMKEASDATLEGQRASTSIKVAQIGAGKGEANPADLDALGKQILDSPDLLDKLSPSVRGQVMAYMGRQGTPLYSDAQNKFDALTERALAAVQRLKQRAGYSTTGLGGAILRVGTEHGLPGSSQQDMDADLKALTAELQLPQMSMMRGMGRLNQNEFNAMGAAATGGLNRDSSTANFKARLDDVEKALLSSKTRAHPQPTPGAAPGNAPMVKLLAPNGQTTMVPADQAGHYIGLGAKVIK